MQTAYCCFVGQPLRYLMKLLAETWRLIYRKGLMHHVAISAVARFRCCALRLPNLNHIVRIPRFLRYYRCLDYSKLFTVTDNQFVNKMSFLFTFFFIIISGLQTASKLLTRWDYLAPALDCLY